MKSSIESIIIFLQFQKVCQHPHSRLREWAGDALTTLIKRATFYDHKPPLSEDLVCSIYTVFFFSMHFIPLFIQFYRKSHCTLRRTHQALLTSFKLEITFLLSPLSRVEALWSGKLSRVKTLWLNPTSNFKAHISFI